MDVLKNRFFGKICGRIARPLFLITWLILGKSLLGQAERHRLEIRPFELTQPPGDDVYFQFVDQIETAGGKLYIRSVQESRIIVVDEGGNILQTFGNQGQGPGEFAGGVLSLAVWGDAVWAQNRGRQSEFQCFKQGKYTQSFEAPSLSLRLFGSHNSNVFGFNGKFAVVPCHPKTGHLAIAHGNDGKTKKVGDILFTRENDMELIRKIPGINDTYWHFDNGFWYALFKFHPLLLRFDENFQQRDSLTLNAPIIDEKSNSIIDAQPTQRTQPVPLLFSDFKIMGNELFVMCSGYLHQFDLEKARLKTVFTFFGSHPDLPKGVPRLVLSPFAITENKKIIMAGIWGDSPLWYADLAGVR